MKLLFIGDIVAKPGRKAVAQLVPELRKQRAVDVVIANGENSAGGSGITPQTAAEIFAAGVADRECAHAGIVASALIEGNVQPLIHANKR